MFVFKELEGRDGEPPHTIGFTDVDVQPLGYDELANARLHEKLTIPLNWDKSKVVLTTIMTLAPLLSRLRALTTRSVTSPMGLKLPCSAETNAYRKTRRSSEGPAKPPPAKRLQTAPGAASGTTNPIISRRWRSFR